MIKNLTSRGNGWHLTLQKNIIKLLGLVPESSKVVFTIKNKVLYIKEILPDNPDFEKGLIRPLSKKGDSWGLYMPNSILELLNINPEVDKVDIEIEGNILLIKRAEQG